MDTLLIITVFIFRLITVILGVMIFKRALEIHKELKPTLKHNSFLLFGIGIVLFTIGDISEEILYEFHLTAVDTLHSIEAIFKIFGFFTIIYSLYKS